MFSAVVLDYWKQEMAVTGDETESGTVYGFFCTFILFKDDYSR